jgi:hypothetical protein
MHISRRFNVFHIFMVVMMMMVMMKLPFSLLSMAGSKNSITPMQEISERPSHSQIALHTLYHDRNTYDQIYITRKAGPTIDVGSETMSNSVQNAAW